MQHGSEERVSRRGLIVGAVLIFLIYNLNLRPVVSGDSLVSIYTPFSIVLDGTISVERFLPHLKSLFPEYGQFVYTGPNGVYFRYPNAQGILLAPFFLPFKLVPGIGELSGSTLTVIGRIYEKLLASGIAILNLWLFWLVARRQFGERLATCGALVLALCSQFFSILAQGLWNHTGGLTLVLLSVLLILSSRTSSRWLVWILPAGFLAGLAFMVRPTNILFIGAAGLTLLAVRRSFWQAVVFGIPSFGLVGLQLLLNRWMYAAAGTERDATSGMQGVSFKVDLLEGFAGIMASPGRGLVLYQPWVILAFAGVILIWRSWLDKRPDEKAEVTFLSVVYCVVHFAVVAKWRGWWGGFCWGPRLLAETTPFLGVLFLVAWQSWGQIRWLRFAIAPLLVFSFFLQFVGAYYYPRGHWESDPIYVNRHEYRLFDWRDNPISRTLKAGPATEPYRIVFAYLRGGAPEARKVMEESGVRVY
jgi:hypothetical protein